ncbi:Guanine nucleotide exchange factor LTE1 [Lecanosticta acicola]|uniref:Guanine nucleotide exchange factor LTE1 n=1 Tax=Lecanosticta acicola TaxID=111012 RepID=A0AAI8YV59_9PEZI|nr:Guanine nucleotide exchange factor LTE1 [Lecanosticta acicola]
MERSSSFRRHRRDKSDRDRDRDGDAPQRQQQQQPHPPHPPPKKPPPPPMRQLRPPPSHLRTDDAKHTQLSPQSDKVRRAKYSPGNNDNDRTALGHKRADTAPTTLPTLAKLSVDDSPTARHFTVTNVGAGGTLYLKPTRMPVPNLSYAPATPSATSDGSSVRSSRPLLRESDLSGTWTLRPQPKRARSSDSAMAGVSVPPLSLANAHNRRRTRSHSTSTVSDRLRATQYDADEFHLHPDESMSSQPRRRSSADLPVGGLSDVCIPHYRLGTPRFSDRGTAYLHYSMYTNSTGGVPSSVLSRADLDKIFPVPPGRGVSSFYSHMSTTAPYLHPSSAYSLTPARTPVASKPPSRPTTEEIVLITPALFDKLEANLDDQTVVHYHPATGRIVAATPARLIAQITSPQCLDYELLADFFLTYRCFMPCLDVLDFLFARMRWAMKGGNDAGRIARVRTFVALRHWILNYFADDFMADSFFRQSFCNLVNEMAASLRQRADGGGGDINIIGEVKKCWRRTCALYYPISDVYETSPDADIFPGGDEDHSLPESSAFGLPLTIRPTTRSHSIFEMTQIQLPERPKQAGALNPIQPQTDGVSHRSPVLSTRTTSIPASPMSEQSLEVLSCSLPFLRHLRPSARSRGKLQKHHPEAPRTVETPEMLGRAEKPKRPTNAHKRSESFQDALRDERAPLASPNADNIELKDLPSFSITGGLVRGILLQPSEPKVDSHVPVTPGPPGPELTEARLAANDGYFANNAHHIGVKKFVGEVRKALGSRKGSTSPSRSAGSCSDGESIGSRKGQRAPRRPQPDWQQLPGPSRLDILSLRIENAYQDAVDQTKKARPDSVVPERPRPPQDGGQAREGATEETQPETVPEEGELEEEKDIPRGETPRPTTDQRQAPSEHESVDVMDFGRMNSHVTTGSRSIVIVDATGAPEIPAMSRAMPSFSSMSSEMMPLPLLRDRNEHPPVPPIPKDYEGNPRLPSQGDPHQDMRSSDERMHDLLTQSQAWEIPYKGQRADSLAKSQKSLSKLHGLSSFGLRSTTFEMPPIHPQLRRRPGGDLKANEHVHELYPERVSARPKPPHRSVSEGTLSTAVWSYATSLASAHESVKPHSDPGRRKSVSLIQMHSSQPVLRPSFVGEADKLKALPDLESGGGVEDALAKLEGKISSPAQSKGSSAGSDTASAHGSGQDSGDEADRSGEGESPSPPLESPPVMKEVPGGESQMSHRSLPFSPSPGFGSSPGQESGVTETQGASIYQLSEFGVQSMSSNTEYPLQPFPRHLRPVSMDSGSSNSIVSPTAKFTRFPIPDPYNRNGGDDSSGSFPYERKPESIPDSVSNGRYPSYRPVTGEGGTHGSFVLDDNQSLSDISTDIASFHEDGVRSFYFDDTEEGAPVPMRPRQPFVAPTPPSTGATDVQQSPDRRRLLPRGTRDPGHTLKQTISAPRLVPQPVNQPYPRRRFNAPRQGTVQAIAQTFPAHLPFVLAFESETIAEQLTIIEKDALDEVDWKDLISLNWQQSPPDVRNWVEYLNKEHANGIDIVVARFNLSVKWVMSEIVLTEVPSERARAITKYIHIAAHCRRLHNYASMYQIVLALLSTDLARLQETWSLVAGRERQMLEQMETLCRPIRNFHNLRAEMETAMPGNGIIPFIGLYTHDLLFNALKSPRINSPTAGQEPLVNFERYQTAATIVKNLLRLIEASAKYAFHPEPEALSRCLWIAALDDYEITQRAKMLEQI